METEQERKSGKHPPYADHFGRTNWVVRNDQLNLATGLLPGAVGIATYATAGAAANPGVLAVTLLFSALAPANAEPIVVGDVHGGRDPLNMTPLPSNPLEKGRGGAPMVPVPTQAPKSGERTPASDKKK